MKSIFVVLQPKSNTNNSDKYRVVDSQSWFAFVNGARKSAAVFGEFDSLLEAEKSRDELNSELSNG
jgi:hypothetical protein